jgi:hypothetical protein
MFAGKARAYPSETAFGAPLYGRLLASPTNIRLSWKGVPRTKAYYVNPEITDKKGFITLTLGMKQSLI